MITDDLKERFAKDILEEGAAGRYPALLIQKQAIVPMASHLKEEKGFDVLMDLCAVDYLRWEDKKYRYEVIYNIFSSSTGERVIVKAAVAETEAFISSVTGVWLAADWYEREVWDMFGIRFKGHPNLKRILMYEKFSGHPLRKDYPYYKRQPQIGPAN